MNNMSSKEKLVLKYLGKNRDVRIDNGNLIHKNVKIGKLKEFMKHLLRKNSDKNVKGLRLFYQLLKKVNFPYFLIKNEEGKKFIAGIGREKWKPPGVLKNQRLKSKRQWKL